MLITVKRSHPSNDFLTARLPQLSPTNGAHSLGMDDVLEKQRLMSGFRLDSIPFGYNTGGCTRVRGGASGYIIAFPQPCFRHFVWLDDPPRRQVNKSNIAFLPCKKNNFVSGSQWLVHLHMM